MSELKALVAEDRDFLRPIVQIAVQEFLEAEMNAALGAGKSERSAHRLGYRSGYYPATLGNAERAVYARLHDKGECAAFASAGIFPDSMTASTATLRESFRSLR
ncbi:MAG TPA: transposase [Chthoniobacteraceae bacterium]|nr:transposase [Chthoniobacteraceae bacterium]